MSTTTTPVAHAEYPHEAGYLIDCPACEALCHCTPGSAPCVFAFHGDEEIEGDMREALYRGVWEG